jgi:hypothetical protein
MSIYDLLNTRKALEEKDVAPGGPTGFLDVAGATLKENYLNFTSISEFAATQDAGQRNLERYRSVHGGDLYQDAVEHVVFDQEEKERLKRYFLNPRQISPGDFPELDAVADKYIGYLKQKYPDATQDLHDSKGLAEQAKKDALLAMRDAEAARFGANGFNRVAGSLTGGVLSGFADPLQVLVMPLGAGVSAGIVKTALVSAGINAATEVALFPVVKKWQNKLGNRYGAAELLSNAGTSALFGAGFGAFFKWLGKAKVGDDPAVAMHLGASSQEKLGNFETANAMLTEARELHLETTAPTDAIPETMHRQLMQEYNDAFLEGRTPDPYSIVPDLDERMNEGVLHENFAVLRDMFETDKYQDPEIVNMLIPNLEGSGKKNANVAEKLNADIQRFFKEGGEAPVFPKNLDKLIREKKIDPMFAVARDIIDTQKQFGNEYIPQEYHGDMLLDDTVETASRMVEPETPGVIFREGANAEEFPKQQVVSTYDNLDAAYNDPVVLKDMSDSVDKYIAENNLLPESVVFRDPDGFEIEIDGKIVRKEEITVQDLKNLREEKEFIKALDHCAIGGSRGK